MDHHLRIIELDRIGHREQRPGARLQPDRLVIHRPVHDVAVAKLLEKVEGMRRLVGARAHPARRPAAFMALDRLSHLAQQPLLVGLPHPAQVLGVGAAVRDHFVAALADRRHHLRRVVVDERVGVVRGRQLQLVEEVEQAPDADAVAVVAPGVVAVRLRLAGLRRVVAEPGAEGKPLDVGGEDEGEALSARPAVVLPFDQRDKIIAAVLRQQRVSQPSLPKP